MGKIAWTRGKETDPKMKGGFGGDLPGVPVFVPDSSGGMTCGAPSSVAGGWRGYRFGRRGKTGRGPNPVSGQSAAPRPFNIFHIFFSVFF
jgi:hypothetical protein